jgi:hypothetical protein
MPSPAAVRRRTAAFALAALAATALASPAHAAEQPLPVAVTGPDSVNLSLHPEADESAEPQIELGLRAPGEPIPDQDGVISPIHTGEYTVTVDARSLAGVAAVDFSGLGGWQGAPSTDSSPPVTATRSTPARTTTVSAVSAWT